MAEGGIDAHVGALGLGVVSSGMLALITGSSHVIIGQADAGCPSTPASGAPTPTPSSPGSTRSRPARASTGSVVAWFKDNLAGGAVAEAAGRGADPYVVLNELAAEVLSGPRGWWCWTTSRATARPTPTPTPAA